jgi:hypothetical protein
LASTWQNPFSVINFGINSKTYSKKSRLASLYNMPKSPVWLQILQNCPVHTEFPRRVPCAPRDFFRRFRRFERRAALPHTAAEYKINFFLYKEKAKWYNMDERRVKVGLRGEYVAGIKLRKAYEPYFCRVEVQPPSSSEPLCGV